MRLFIAIKFDDELNENIASVQEILSLNGIKGRWSTSENFHLTLTFLGVTHQKDELINIMDSLTCSRFELSLDEVMNFNNTIILTTSHPPKLKALALDLDHQLRVCGFKIPKRKFIPHITLCRGATNFQHLIGYKPQPIKTEIKSISLMQSILTSTGAVYKELYRVEF